MSCGLGRLRLLQIVQFLSTELWHFTEAKSFMTKCDSKKLLSAKNAVFYIFSTASENEIHSVSIGSAASS